MDPAHPLLGRILRSLLSVAACGLAACAAPLTLERIDGYARSTNARTILLERDLTLYSPYEMSQTRGFLTEIRTQRDEVFALLGVTDDLPLLVWLRPNEGLSLDFTVEDDRLRVNRVSRVPEDGVLGRAAGRNVVIEVDPPGRLELPDGRQIESAPGAGMFTDTIRHELTHVATTRLGLEGADWLREGIAHAVEWIPVEDGRFRLDPAPEALRGAAELPRDEAAFERLLAWRQSFPPADSDILLRRQALTLVVYALEQQHAASLREGLLRVAALEAETLRALRPGWSEWLARLFPAES